MQHTTLFVPTLKEAPADAMMPSHVLLLRAGYIRQVGAGIYSLLPLGLRVVQRVTAIIREELSRAGAQELLLPAVMPADIWKESGRWAGFGPELLKFQDRKGGDYCLGPTHEEAIVDLVRSNVRSYRQLPLNLYQIQTKFRDEPRPRAGLMRGREFLMKDAYSFDADEEGALKTYERMYRAYRRIFRRCGLDFRPVEADTGTIGGKLSHEFQVLTDTGEDAIVACDQCDYAANVEMACTRPPPPAPPDTAMLARAKVPTPGKRTIAVGGDTCPRCNSGHFRDYRGIEVGHVFFLGTHYSECMSCNFLDAAGTERPMVMGCYGIGVTRTVAATIEQHHDADGIIWPMPLAPFQVHLLALQMQNARVRDTAERLKRDLEVASVEVLYDDREERPGVKFKDADLIGVPLRVAVGEKSLAEGFVELKTRGQSVVEKLPEAEVASVVASRVRAELARFAAVAE